MNKRIIAAAVLAAMLAAAGCDDETKNNLTAALGKEAVNVAAQSVEVGDITRETAYAGRIMPGESVYVIGKVAGTVKDTYFDVGQEVKAGDLLFEIDPVDVQLSVNQAKAAYDSAKASVDMQLGSTLESQLLSAESGYKQAREALEAVEDQQNAVGSTLSELKTLKSSVATLKTNDPTASSQQTRDTLTGFADVLGVDLPDFAASSGTGSGDGEGEGEGGGEAAQTETGNPPAGDTYAGYAVLEAALGASIREMQSAYDQLDISYNQAEIAYKTARTANQIMSKDAVEQATAAAEAGLQQAKVAYDAALTQLAYCKVTSPIDGIVELKNVTKNGMASQSNYAYVISNKDSMTVTFGVPAEVSNFLETGDVVTVENGSVVHKATITEVGTMTNMQSGLFDVKATITGECADLLSGISVKLTAITEESIDALIIPTSAVYYDDGSAYVYVVRDGAAVKTMVETGIIDGVRTEVTEGLSEDDVVITTWDAHLRDGAQVNVKED